MEARRVLAPTGQFIVSTPNKLYYTESRGAAGANPFHVHEFEFEEFRGELTRVFPHVSLFLENHVEGVTFQPHERRRYGGSAGGCGRSRCPTNRTFFVAVCAHRPQIGNPTFVYVPRAGQRAARARTPHRRCSKRELAPEERLAGEERSRIWRNCERQHRGD